MRAALIFLLFFCSGVVLAALYVFLQAFFRSKTATVLFDSFFSVGAIASFVWAFVFLSDGVFRAYVIVAPIAGVVISVFLFKPTLDKWSSALYNALTRKTSEGDDDGKVVLQKVVGNFDGGGDIAGGNSVVRSADVPDAKGNA